LTICIDQAALDAIFDLPDADGAFSGDLANYLARTFAQNSLFLLAFAPKAGGTFFREAAAIALDGRLERGSHAPGGRDATPYLPNFLRCALDQNGPANVMHMHMQAFPANRHFMEALDLRPVIMLRSVPDMLASFWDMLEQDPQASADGLNCAVPSDFPGLSRARKGEFLVSMIAPWYASYFASWHDFHKAAPDRVCVLRYQDLCRHPAQVLYAALDHAELYVDLADCEAAIDIVWGRRYRHRFNRGISGRGRDYFTAAQIDRIAGLLSLYPQLGDWKHELLGADTSIRAPWVAPAFAFEQGACRVSGV
jgi:hypothetical protein